MRLWLMGLALCGLTWPQAAGQPVTAGRTGEVFVPGQVIVKLESGLRGRIAPVVLGGVVQLGVERLDRELRRFRVTRFEPIVRGPVDVLSEFGADLLYAASFDPHQDIGAVAAALEKTGLVEYACPNVLLPLCGGKDETPDDPRFGEQWALTRIRAPRAWEITHGSSEVVVAVLDDGLYWPHEDISANVWVNRDEDINGNGRLDTLPPPEGDLDGIDQDDNSYVDDVIGWDFVDFDPNPMPADSDVHGTSCWGAANAVTDNGVGIAAPPWNVRGMALRCGAGGSLNMAAVIGATYYGIVKNAWVYSMSFGSFSPHQPLYDACQAIWSTGALSVASARHVEPSYPAAYENVVGVSASDTNDCKAPFGGYGWWVDVCAPGVAILTTSLQGYACFDGTSLSTPLTAGVLAWLKSARPAMSNDTALALLYELCDSMPDPLYRAGLLGHGRIAMVPDTLTGLAGNPALPQSPRLPTICRGVLNLQSGISNLQARPVLLDIAGRQVMELEPGPNDIRHLAPGVYFVGGEGPRIPGFEASARGPEGCAPSVRKIVIQR